MTPQEWHNNHPSRVGESHEAKPVPTLAAKRRPMFRIIRHRLFKVQSREARIAVPHFRPLLQKILRTSLPVTVFQTVLRLTPSPVAKQFILPILELSDSAEVPDCLS
jgi:hypothetical protein